MTVQLSGASSSAAGLLYAASPDQLRELPVNVSPSSLQPSENDSGVNNPNLPFEVDDAVSDTRDVSQMPHWQDYRPNVELIEPAVLSDSSPALPSPAAGTSNGVVRLALLVSESGNLDAVLVGDSSIDSAMFDRVMSVIKTWRYAPARVDGVPTKVRIVLEITVESPPEDDKQRIVPEKVFGNNAPR